MLPAIFAFGDLRGLLHDREPLRGPQALVLLPACSDSNITRAGCKEETPSEERLYEIWLEAIGEHEAQEITPAAVRDCIRIINTILPLRF